MLKLRYYRLIHLFCFICLFQIVHSQSFSSPKIFTTLDGLAGSHTNVLHLDKRGFLWIGTNKGISQYYGYSFFSYPIGNDSLNSLPGKQVLSIYSHDQHCLFIGTNKGYCMFRYNTKDFFTPSFTDSLFQPGKVTGFASISESLVLIISSHGMLIHNINNNSVSLLKEMDFDPYHDTKDLGIYTWNNNILIYTQNTIYTFDKFNYNLQQLYSFAKENTIYCLFSKKEKLYLGTRSGIYSLSQPELRGYEANRLNTMKVYSAAPYLSHGFVVVSDRGALYWNDKQNKISPIDPANKQNKALLALPMCCIIKDSSNIFWLGSSKGLIKLDSKSKAFYSYPSKPLLDNSMNILSMTNYNEHIVVGTENNGILFYPLVKLDNNTPPFKEQVASQYLKGQKINVLTEIDNILFIGTSRGLYATEDLNLNPKYISLKLHGKTINLSITDISGTELSHIYFSSDTNLYHYDFETDKVSSYTIFRDNTASSANGITCFEALNDTLLLIGTQKGLICYNLFDSIPIKSVSEFKTITDEVFSLLVRNGLIYVGTNNGVYMIDQKNRKISHVSVKNGLACNRIIGIKPDTSGFIWLTTAKGITRYHPEKKILSNYSYLDGINTPEFNIQSICMINNWIYTGSKAGFCYFNPKTISINTCPPKIEYLRFEYHIKNQPYIAHPTKNNQIIIPDNFHFLHVDFAALDFTNPINNTYKYTLYKENSEILWNWLNTKNCLTISHLKNGEYSLWITGSNNDHVWNSNGNRIRILVKTSVWRSQKAIAGYLILFVILFFFVNRYRTRALRLANKAYKEKDRIARQIEQQKEELSAKNKNITDSINYARRLQTAMIPSERIFKSILSESFVLHMPKDIVSGDFYWINENKDKIYVAAVDCTGHGVPGAFMSIIGLELFRRITATKGIIKPSDILNALNKDFSKIFKDVENITLRDGMDVAFCVFHKSLKKLEFAGAFNPLYLVRANKIIEYKGDRFSVGLEDNDTDQQLFTNHEIEIKNDDIIYLFSDGFADQFGGPEGKKFKYRRFRHLILAINQLPMERQYEFLKNSIMEWKGNSDQIDDILVIGIKIKF